MLHHRHQDHGGRRRRQKDVGTVGAAGSRPTFSATMAEQWPNCGINILKLKTMMISSTTLRLENGISENGIDELFQWGDLMRGMMRIFTLRWMHALEHSKCFALIWHLRARIVHSRTRNSLKGWCVYWTTPAFIFVRCIRLLIIDFS